LPGAVCADGEDVVGATQAMPLEIKSLTSEAPT